MSTAASRGAIVPILCGIRVLVAGAEGGTSQGQYDGRGYADDFGVGVGQVFEVVEIVGDGAEIEHQEFAAVFVEAHTIYVDQYFFLSKSCGIFATETGA